MLVASKKQLAKESEKSVMLVDVVDSVNPGNT